VEQAFLRATVRPSYGAVFTRYLASLREIHDISFLLSLLPTKLHDPNSFNATVIKYPSTHQSKRKQKSQTIIMPPTKTKEELEKEQQEAKEQLSQIMKTSKPKNLGQGLGRGVSNILAGAVGGVGIAVVAPTMGLAVGARGGGIIGGAVGLTAGAVVG
jgi:hypothetical protein